MSYNFNKFLLEPKAKRKKSEFDLFIIPPREVIDEVTLSRLESKRQMVRVSLSKHSTKRLVVK